MTIRVLTVPIRKNLMEGPPERSAIHGAVRGETTILSLSWARVVPSHDF